MFHFWPFWFFWPFHGLVTLVLIIVIVVLIVRHQSHPLPQTAGVVPSRSEALAILEARYARGEIQREEYLQKKADLGG